MSRMPPLAAVIFDLSDMCAIDSCGVQIFCEIVQAYQQRGIKIAFVNLLPSSKNKYVLSGLIDIIGGSHFFFGSVSEAKLFLEGITFSSSTYINVLDSRN